MTITLAELSMMEEDDIALNAELDYLETCDRWLSNNFDEMMRPKNDQRHPFPVELSPKEWYAKQLSILNQNEHSSNKETQ